MDKTYNYSVIYKQHQGDFDLINKVAMLRPPINASCIDVKHLYRLLQRPVLFTQPSHTLSISLSLNPLALVSSISFLTNSLNSSGLSR